MSGQENRTTPVLRSCLMEGPSPHTQASPKGDTRCLCSTEQKTHTQKKIKSGQVPLERHSIPDSCWQCTRVRWILEDKANVLEETHSGRADGCGRMVWQLYCVNTDAHGLNSESESN